MVSSLRKTIIIHTSSIIEGLLFWKLGQVEKNKKVEIPSAWKYCDIVVLHKIDESEQIVAGKRKREQRNIETIDFKHVIDLCYENKICSKSLEDDLHTMRELRNRQHLGSLKTLDKKYTKSEIEFCFGVAKTVKELVANG